MTSGENMSLRSDITTTATPYTSGDVIGGLIPLYPGGCLPGYGTVQAVNLIDTLNQKPPLTLLLFNQKPTGGTYTDNLPFAWGAGDYAKLADGGIIGVATADFVTIASVGIAAPACQSNLRWDSFADGSPPNVWMVIVSGGTPTYGANATSLFVTLGVVAGKTP